MKKLSALCVLLLAFLCSTGMAQQGGYKIVKITSNLIPTPQIQFTGEQRATPGKDAKWLEIEVLFQSSVEFTDELNFKYYVLIGQTLLVGDVSHINIAKGQEMYSVMYVSPKSITRLLGNRSVTANIVRNVAVQLSYKGQVLDTLFMKPESNGQWFTTMQQTGGLLLNKNETPFAPLYWDRYEVLKPKN